MQDKSNILVPIKPEEASDAQKDLMLVLNQMVSSLFKQDDILLLPSPEMNRDRLWERLKIVQSNPKAHVGYWFGAQINVSEDGEFWLNVHLTVWPSDGEGGNNLVFLTPNQTHWICDKLKTHPLLRERLNLYVNAVISKLRGGLDLLQRVVDKGNFWEENGKSNPVFDEVTGDAFRRGLYTSRLAFMENICPLNMPWSSRDPNLQRQWEHIKMYGGRT